MLADASDAIVANLSARLRDRKLYQCLEIRTLLEKTLPRAGENDEPSMQAFCVQVVERLQGWLVDNESASHKLLLDRASRDPHKDLQESKGLLNRIRIRSSLGNELVDLESRSAVVKAMVPMDSWRVYMPRGDAEIRKVIDDAVKEVAHGQPNQAQA
jgi:uncharacterized protein